MPRELTVKEYAGLERVTERTVYRWIAEGKIANLRRTPGGSLRIPSPLPGSPSPHDALIILTNSDKA